MFLRIYIFRFIEKTWENVHIWIFGIDLFIIDINESHVWRVHSCWIIILLGAIHKLRWQDFGNFDPIPLPCWQVIIIIASSLRNDIKILIIIIITRNFFIQQIMQLKSTIKFQEILYGFFWGKKYTIMIYWFGSISINYIDKILKIWPPLPLL